MRGDFTICQRTGKRSYTSRRLAHRCSRGTGAKLRAYRCALCGGWHVTKQPTGGLR